MFSERIPAVIIGMMMAGSAQAAVNHIPLRSDMVIAPGGAETVIIEAQGSMEIGWDAVPPCNADCIKTTDRTDDRSFNVVTRLGGVIRTDAVDGQVTMEFANIADHPVTLNVYRAERVCDAESCRLINDAEEGRWMVFKIDEFTSIETSADESYSTISGITTGGKPFIIKAVWWRYDPREAFACAQFIRRYLDEGTPKEQYNPYVLAGMVVEADEVVLTSVDTCSPKAPNFGAPTGSIY